MKATAELVLRPIEMPKVTLNAATSSEQALRERIWIINVEVNPDLWTLFQPRELGRVPYAVKVYKFFRFRNFGLGEILSSAATFGCLLEWKDQIKAYGDTVQRCHLITRRWTNLPWWQRNRGSY